MLKISPPQIVYQNGKPYIELSWSSDGSTDYLVIRDHPYSVRRVKGTTFTEPAPFTVVAYTVKGDKSSDSIMFVPSDYAVLFEEPEVNPWVVVLFIVAAICLITIVVTSLTKRN